MTAFMQPGARQRALTPDERALLWQALARAYDLDPQHLEDEPPLHVCWDGYISDGPGYHGPVVVILWHGGPEMIESWTWDRDANGWRQAA